MILIFVTLHVSVWVEITGNQTTELLDKVTLHVSVWVEIGFKRVDDLALKSRSTWACELKWKIRKNWKWHDRVTLHVSVWVEMENSTNKRRIRMSRSTWACELKFVISSTVTFRSMSRSTWACELKFLAAIVYNLIASHAPRERVSWNHYGCSPSFLLLWSRSTWACELKCGDIQQGYMERRVTLHVSVWVEIVHLSSF